jgi:hypothetical protein
LEKAFAEEGGLRERMTKARLEIRSQKIKTSKKLVEMVGKVLNK